MSRNSMIVINNEDHNVTLVWKNNRMSCVNLDWCIVETSSYSYEAIFHERVKLVDIATLLHCNFLISFFFSDTPKGSHIFFEDLVLHVLNNDFFGVPYLGYSYGSQFTFAYQ